MSVRRPTLRGLAAVAVIAAWGVSLTLLAFRRMEADDDSQLSLLASRQLAPEGVFFALMVGNTQVGTAGITLDTLSPGYRILETMTLELPTDTGLVKGLWWTETKLSPSLTLIEAERRFIRDGRRVVGSMRKLGPYTLAMQVGVDSGRAYAQGRGDVVPAIALSYRLALRRNGLGVGGVVDELVTSGWPGALMEGFGRSSTDSIIIGPDSSEIDPKTLRFLPVHYDTAKVYRMMISGPAGPYQIWVERTGTIAAIEYPLGLQWVRTDFDMALTNYRRDFAAGAHRQVRTALPRLVPYASSTRSRPAATSDEPRAFRVTRRDGRPIPNSLLTAFSGGRQRVRGDTIWISQDERVPDLQGARASDPFVGQDSIVLNLAEMVKTSPTGAGRIATILSTLTRTITLDTSYTASQEGLTTLKRKRGRADGIARLFVALAQASGQKARYVVGFAVLNDTLRTHAWAEVWDTEVLGWTAVDPVNGRVAASTYLIRTGFAGSSHPDDMLPIIADVRLTELDLKGTP